VGAESFSAFSQDFSTSVEKRTAAGSTWGILEWPIKINDDCNGRQAQRLRDEHKG
jgi:hypothetical protein